MLKKALLAGTVIALSACSVYNDNSCGCVEMQEQEVLESVIYEQMPIEINPCKCAYNVETTREVLRPRIEVIIEQKSKRNCPKDNQSLNCGCGNCPTFNESEQYETQMKKIVPAMPEAYELASSRVFNRFIKDTVGIYSAKPNVLLYVKPANVKSDDLPDGVSKGVDLFKKKVLSSFTYAITDDEDNNDYYLETSVDWFDTVSKTVPAIKYDITLYDNKNNMINTWVEVVKKAENSEQWL